MAVLSPTISSSILVIGILRKSIPQVPSSYGEKTTKLLALIDSEAPLKFENRCCERFLSTYLLFYSIRFEFCRVQRLTPPPPFRHPSEDSRPPPPRRCDVRICSGRGDGRHGRLEQATRNVQRAINVAKVATNL